MLSSHVHVNHRDLIPYLNDTQFEFRDSVNRFLENHATPEYIRECDENKAFPKELIDAVAEQGWFAVSLPEEYGGIGGHMDMIAMLEILGYHSVALSRYWNMNVNMIGGAIARFASEDIKQMTLPGLAEGKTFFAFALSENGSGSDAASLKTKGCIDGNDLVVNGTKNWITGALQADYILTACRTQVGESKHDGISLVLIPADTPGVSISPIDMLGGHAIRTCEVNLVDVRVPKTNLVGDLHKGWKQVMSVLSKERIALGAMCVGAAQAAYDLSANYAMDRHQFGRSITKFQAVSHKLVDMQTSIEASRLLVFRAAKLLEEGIPCSREASQAKYFASDTYMKVATDGLQVMGANGYCTEYAMERHFREAKLFQIFGGTNEIQHNIIAGDLFSGA